MTITTQPTNLSTPTIRRESPPAKCIFASKTFWGIIFTTIAAIAPIVGESVDEGKFSGSDIAQIVVILCGTGATVVGRVGAGNVYTPDFMPGPSKKDMG
ncbi:MAG: hypothetical protein WA902_23105 [Thermosynechococcaceae cyanobacterium]